MSVCVGEWVGMGVRVGCVKGDGGVCVGGGGGSLGVSYSAFDQNGLENK